MRTQSGWVLHTSTQPTFIPVPEFVPANGAVNGRNATMVYYGDDTVVGYGRWKGSFFQRADGTWVEQANQVSDGTRGQVLATFTETGRDDWSVRLRMNASPAPNRRSRYASSGASATVALDLWKKTATARLGSQSVKLGWVTRADNAVPEAPPSAEEQRLINEQERTSNYYNLTSPLTSADLDKVMQWIGQEASATTVDFCWKPTPPYGRGAGYTGRGACEAGKGAGNCEPWGAFWYPKCKPGWHAAGCCICSKDCPTVAEVLQHGQNVKIDCGELCALSLDECASGVKDMVFAPINMALNIVSFGLSGAAANAAKTAAAAGASAATGGAAAVASGVTKTALSPQWSGLLNALNQAEQVVDTTATAVDTFQYLVENVENLSEEVNRWSVHYDNNFSGLASYRIEQIINRHFPDTDDRSYIKQKYGQYHLTAMLESDGWRIAKTVLTAVSVEPTGIVSTINAFAHPTCRTSANPFPSVTLVPKANRQGDCRLPLCGKRDPTTRSHPRG